MKNEVPLLAFQSFATLLEFFLSDGIMFSTFHIGESVFPIDFVTLCTSILHVIFLDRIKT